MVIELGLATGWVGEIPEAIPGLRLSTPIPINPLRACRLQLRD